MTSVTDGLRLAADFAPATYEDWRKLVDGVLKGAPFEKLVGKTYDGLKIDPIYPRAKGATPIVCSLIPCCLATVPIGSGRTIAPLVS